MLAATETIPSGSLPPQALTTALVHLYAQLCRPTNLVPRRPGRTSPRARKRGGSTRYDKRPTATAPVRTVTHEIVLHRLPVSDSDNRPP